MCFKTFIENQLLLPNRAIHLKFQVITNSYIMKDFMQGIEKTFDL